MFYDILVFLVALVGGITIGYVIWGSSEKKKGKSGKCSLEDVYNSVERTRVIVSNGGQRLLKIDDIFEIQRRVIDLLNSQYKKQDIMNRVMLKSFPTDSYLAIQQNKIVEAVAEGQLTVLNKMVSKVLKVRQEKKKNG